MKGRKPEGSGEARAAGPDPLPVRIEQRGRVAVAVAVKPMTPLTADEVERVRREILDQRYFELIAPF